MRFQIHEEIGRGATGVVSRATDPTLEREVALKQLIISDSATLLGLKSEFRVRHQISHPGLVQLYELGGDDAGWWISMEYVEGAPLVDHIRENLEPGEPLSPARIQQILNAFQKLATAVHTLHRQGCLHRDLKPSNVLVNKEGRVVVLDFGLAVRAEARPLQQQNFSGTLMYMSPEQMLGRPATPESDWYAIGAMLSECLTGHPLFEGSAPAIAAAKYRDDLPNLNNADERPSQLAITLLSNSAQQRDPGILLKQEHYQRDHGSDELVARNQELEILENQLSAVCKGSKRIVEIIAESGLGKTALMQSFTTQYPEALMLTSRCNPRESVPFNALDGAIDIIAQEQLLNLSTGTEPDLAEASILFPNLGGSKVESNPNSAPTAIRRSALQALARLFRNLRGPIILWIDDAQWADRDSGIALKELFDSESLPPILVVLSYQENLVIENGLVEVFKEVEITADASLILKPLSESHAKLLIEKEAASSTEAFVSAVISRAKGSPLLLRDFARYFEPNVDVQSHDVLDSLISKRLESARVGSTKLADIIAIGGHSLYLQEMLKLFIGCRICKSSPRPSVTK